MKIRSNAILANTSWFGVGGAAEMLFRPKDEVELAEFLKNNNQPITILGACSNVIIRDGGIRGVVIKLGRGFNYINHNDSCLIVGASVSAASLANYCASHGIVGMEFMGSIPGLVGGAIAMNAGCYGNETANYLIAARALDYNGTARLISADEMCFSYRNNEVAKNYIFIEAIYKISKERALPAIIRQKMLENATARAATQPIKTRTGGSTFKNPPDKKAWQLIDDAGCRGLAIGDAKMSELHCNFMINEGSASAADLESLGEEVRRRVYEYSGEKLEWEIKILGQNIP